MPIADPTLGDVRHSMPKRVFTTSSLTKIIFGIPKTFLSPARSAKATLASLHCVRALNN